jgi:hypothetical protein
VTIPRRTLAALTIAVGTVLAVASCALPGDARSTPDGVTSLARWAEYDLAALPGVVAVEAGQFNETEDVGADMLDADLWGMDLVVVVDPLIDADDIAAVAEATREFSEAHAGTAAWAARVTIAPVTASVDDSSAPDRLRVDVYPDVVGSAAEAARDALEVTTIPSVASVTVMSVPSIQVTEAADLGAALEAVERLPFWADGGNLSTVDGRVRLADVPELVTDAGLLAIIEAARAHPGGQFWLEAANVGPRYPELYVDGVSAEEAAAIAARFVDPAMVAATASAYVLEFNIRAVGAEGAIDTYGTFGGVPSP